MIASLLLGAAAGLRSVAPLAILAAGNRNDRPVTAALTTLAAAGELVADKLPGVPARTAAVPAIARLASGAVAGAAVQASNRRVAGAVLGAMGAAAGTWAGYALRTGLARRAGRDWPIAIAEDASAVGLSLLALRLART